MRHTALLLMAHAYRGWLIPIGSASWSTRRAPRSVLVLVLYSLMSCYYLSHEVCIKRGCPLADKWPGAGVHRVLAVNCWYCSPPFCTCRRVGVIPVVASRAVCCKPRHLLRPLQRQAALHNAATTVALACVAWLVVPGEGYEMRRYNLWPHASPGHCSAASLFSCTLLSRRCMITNAPMTERIVSVYVYVLLV